MLTQTASKTLNVDSTKLNSSKATESNAVVPTQPEDLLNGEESLYRIWRRSRRLVPGWFDLFVIALAVIVLTAFVLLTKEPVSPMADRLRSWADTGSNFAISILGFLIAGFTIFATITKPELFVKLATTPFPKYRTDYLKYSFYAFMQVFIHFMMFLGLCFSVKLLGSANGPISVLVSATISPLHLSADAPAIAKLALVKAGTVLVGSYLVYCLLLLKSFLFNTYTVTVLSVMWNWREVLNQQNHH